MKWSQTREEEEEEGTVVETGCVMNIERTLLKLRRIQMKMILKYRQPKHCLRCCLQARVAKGIPYEKSWMKIFLQMDRSHDRHRCYVLKLSWTGALE
jgi:hypothetical protein